MSYDNQQWQPPPMGGGYPPPPGPSGYAPTAPAIGGNGLSTAALITGICAVGFPILGYILLSTVSSPYDMGLIKFGTILFFLAFFVGVIAISLGIVSVSLAGQNPARKAKGTVGLCLGILPFVVLVILMMSASGPGPFGRPF